jgi:phosphatidylserine/phosphatidylglycerophosphate/cardiolipin synthase-like enzyme
LPATPETAPPPKIRGVDVLGVFDESQLRSNTGSEYEWLLGAGLDVRIDGSPDKLHHKVIIIDGRIVITGSYNFSVSAESRNDENLVVIFDEEVAGVYLEEWERVYSIGK